MEDAHAQTTVKKAAIVVLISLAHEAEKKTIEELQTEIQKALEEGSRGYPGWLWRKSSLLKNKCRDVKPAHNVRISMTLKR